MRTLCLLLKGAFVLIENQLLLGEPGNLPAPKLFRRDRPDAPSLVTHAELRAFFAGADIFRPYNLSLGDYLCGEHDLEEKDMPSTPGRVVFVCQLKRNGSGFIRVRWGEAFARGSILAEYHFAASETIESSN